MRTWEPKDGNADGESAASRRCASLVSGITHPGEGGRHHARDRVGEEGRPQPIALGEDPARQRTDAHREEKDAVIDGHDAAPPSGRADVREHDLAGDEHEPGSDARHESSAHEHGEARRVRAEKIAGGGGEAADGEGGPATDPIRELSGGHGDQEASEAVDRDGDADGRLRDAEGAGIEREGGDDAAEAELVDGDEHAHPEQDAVGPRLRHGRYRGHAAFKMRSSALCWIPLPHRGRGQGEGAWG